MKLFGGIFAIIGLIFLTVIIFIIVEQGENKYLKETGNETVGVIVEVRRVQRSNSNDFDDVVYIEYTPQNREPITTTMNFYDSSMRVGREFRVWYDPDNPEVFHSELHDSMILLVFLIIPVSFIIVGTTIFVKDVRQSLLLRKLLVEGRCVQVPVYELRDANVRINRVTQLWVVVMHDGRVYRSKAVPPYQAEQLRMVDLYLSNDGSGRYVVDVKGSLRK
jgi:hypothetical protein